MILKPSVSVVQFFRRLRIEKFAPHRVTRALPALVSGICLSTRKRTLTELASFVSDEQRDKSTVSRIFEDHRFCSRDLHRAAANQFITDLIPDTDTPVTWLLSVDSTCTKRGGFTKILGANNYRFQRKPTKSQRSTKAHTFLMATLVSHEGVRIPLPRYTCYPKSFKKPGTKKRHRQTQIDLAVSMIKGLRKFLPEHIKLVVVVDQYFEGSKLFRVAIPDHLVIITPLASNRCFANISNPQTSNGRRIQTRGLNIPPKTFASVVLRRGSEKTVRYRRYSARKPGPNDYRTYDVYHESRTVAALGTVGLVYSWKCPVYEPRRDFGWKRFKVLVCSDPSWSGADIVEWYELRWPSTETLFRELKQELGLGDYVGQSLEAFERYVDCVLVSLLLLEKLRKDILDSPQAKLHIREKAQAARTGGMRSLLRLETSEQLVSVLKRASDGAVRAKRDLKHFLAAVMASSNVDPPFLRIR